MKVISCILGTLFLAFSLLWSQSVEIKEKEDKPLADIGGAGGQTRGLSSPRPSAKPDQYTIRYIQINPGPYGSIQGLSSESAMDQKLTKEFNFPSLSILVCVAARLIPASSYDGAEKIEGSVKGVTELRQMCLNIRLSGLDSNKMVISQPLKAINQSLNANNYFVNEFGKEPILTLGIAPYETLYSQITSQESKISSSVQVGAATASTASGYISPYGALAPIASFINPLGALASGISAVFSIFSPTENAPTQISYQSASNEFGWIWRQREGIGIEGIHNCMALLRAHKSVRYILAEVDLITDWKRFGAWMKQMDFIIPVASD